MFSSVVFHILILSQALIILLLNSSEAFGDCCWVGLRVDISVLHYQASEIPVTIKAGRNALLCSNTLLKLILLNLQSTSYQTLLEASRDKNTICWCEWLLPNGILPYAGCDHPEPSLFHWRRSLWLAIDKLTIADRLTDTIWGVTSPGNTANKEPIQPR